MRQPLEELTMTMATIAVTVTPEAAARIAELGMQAELERMLQHTRQTVSALRAIEVQLALPYDTGEETTIVIEVTMDDPRCDDDPTDTDWARWQVRNFPTEVCRYFVMISDYGQADER
jgi:hypothetical protein